MEFNHISVLLEESVEALDIKPDGIYVDCTAGGGGHSAAVAEKLTTGRLISIDQDPEAIAVLKKRFENNYFSGTQGIDDIFTNIFRADLTTQAFATSFTKDYVLKFNFIQFEFFNENETNCIINNLSVLYTLGYKQKGVS